MKIFNLPDLGEGLTEAEIHEWHVKEGDIVKTDDLMVSMETAKAVVEVPAPCNGRIVKFFGKEGDMIDTDAPLVEFESDDETADVDNEDKAATVVGNIQESNQVLEESATGITPTKKASSVIKAMPAVRALAKKLGVDLANVTATGPNGQMTASDVENAVNSKGTAHTCTMSGKTEAIRGVRRTMAQAMAHSNSEVCGVTIVDDADIDAWPKGTDITVRMVRAIAAACEIEPALNAHYDHINMSRTLLDSLNIGLAVDAPDGLLVPVIKDSANLSDEALREKINSFKTGAQDRSIASDDFKDCGLTLSNFGTFAGRYANPVVVQPTVAILGVGRFRKTVVCVGDSFEAHRILPLSLSFDHRAVTGGEASRFLAAVIAHLQDS